MDVSTGLLHSGSKARIEQLRSLSNRRGITEQGESLICFGVWIDHIQEVKRKIIDFVDELARTTILLREGFGFRIVKS